MIIVIRADYVVIIAFELK